MKIIHLTSRQFLMSVIVLLASALSPTFAQTEDKVVAVVNGREIRQSEVDNLVLAQVMPLEEQLFAIRKATLENLVLTTLLEAEAAKRGARLEHFRKTLTAGTVEVRPAEVEAAYIENAAAFGAMSPDEAKERVRLDLEARARLGKYREAVTALRSKAVVEIFLQQPRWPALATAEGSPSLGAKESLITIFEFADFQCPFCRESQRVIKQLLKTYGHEVRLVFKHLPLDIHSRAFAASQAAFCAGQQSRFWEYQDMLFSSSSLDAAALRETAHELKLSLEEFDRCLDSDLSRAAVMQDKRDAARLGITSTPTFVVNGKLVRGATDFETFKNLIEQELTTAKTKSASAASGSHDVRRKK